MTAPIPELDPVLDLTFRNASLGDVLQDDEAQPIPDGWHLMDGARMLSYEWPDFVAAMGIQGGQFILPAPQRVAPGRRWLIKLGEHRPLPPAPKELPRPNPRMTP